MTVAAEPSGTQTNVPRARRRLGGGLLKRLSGLAVVAGALLGVLAFPQAAMAQNQFTGTLSSGDQWVDIGGAPVNIAITIQAPPNPQGASTSVQASLDGISDYAYVGIVDAGGCAPESEASVRCDNVEMSGTRTITFAITPMPESDLPEGETKDGRFKVTFDGGEQAVNITVNGHAANSTGVISGKVTSNAEPVEGAKVVLTDADGNDHEAETGGDGGFQFDGAAEGIVPGDLVITVTKDGYEEATQDLNVSAGSSYQANLTLPQVETEETSSAAPTSEAPTSAAESSAPAEDEGGVSGTLIFLIVIGALLVVGGIVGIVFLLRGGKDDKDDDGESFAPDGPPEHQPTAAQVGTPGVYQAGPAPGSEAPTMIHPGGLVDGPAAPTQFGPAYSGADSTQVMPQAGFGAAPGVPGLGPDGTTILPVVKQPGGPGASDATQIMPQANLSKPPMTAPPSAFADPGATRPHPGPSAPPNPYADPNATRPHPGQSAPSNPYGAPSAPPNPYGAPSALPNPYSDPNATRPHPGASPYGADPGATRPHPSPTPPPPATGSMFEPQNPANAPGGPSEQRFSAPSAPQYGPGSQGYGAQPSQPAQPGQPSQYSQPQSYGSHSAPSAPPGADAYPGQSMRRDPYAPQEQPAPPTGEYGATRAMPQHGDQSQPPAPYGADPNRDGRGEDEDPDSRRTERRSWGEWDDRPRSW